jgi:hypothetical protein
MNQPTYTPTEALQQFGINWETYTRPLYRGKVHDGEFTYEATGDRETFNSSTGERLGIVSSKYQPIHNKDIAQAITEALPDPRCIVAGGSYRNGKRVWLQADLGGMSIGGIDPVQRFALFYTDHDGTGSLKVCPATFRLFCGNQLNAATRDHTSVSIRHTSGYDRHNMIERIHSAITGTSHWLDQFETLASELADDASIDGTWLSKYFQRAYLETCSKETQRLIINGWQEGCEYPIGYIDRAERAANRAARAVADMAANYADCDGGRMPASVRGSRWHAFNAATEWIDHSGRHGAESVQLGNAAGHKVRMLELAERFAIL